MIYSFNFIKIIRNNEDIRNYFDYTVDRYDTWSLYPTKSGKPKSIYASRIIELRKQFIPFCGCEIEEPEINEIVDMEENPDSSQDYIYEWHLHIDTIFLPISNLQGEDSQRSFTISIIIRFHTC